MFKQTSAIEKINQYYQYKLQVAISQRMQFECSATDFDMCAG